jgi:hyaluronoglucosaminidase
VNDFFYGVIEGFYGRQWSWAAREALAAFLALHDFECYLYAPKADSLLRSNWRKSHSPVMMNQLTRLGCQYHKVGMQWGIGLSPLGLSEHYCRADSVRLRQKVEQINELNPDILCILFDDTRGDINDLASRQLEVTHDIMSVSCAKQHIVCPTYYSFDPVLEQVFGKMPEAYLQTLGAGLKSDVGVFWTGDKVIAEQFTRDDLSRVSGLLQRKPILWDNYPVNDGRVTSNHLHLRPYTGRPYQLRDWSAGHIVNPMNQPNLSRLVLQSLAKVYQLEKQYNVEEVFGSGLQGLVSEKLAKMLQQHSELFQEEGLNALSSSQKQSYSVLYQSFNEPIASEVADWLAGGYQFDPQCLTD